MRMITIASLTVLLFLVPAFRAVETLPAQLSDSEFWGLVTDSSEDGGTFLSENFLSNERGFQYVIPPLLQKIQPGGVYMGVGPEQNFTYVSAFHPKIAFVVDIRRQNMIEHLLYKAVFEMSSNRVEFLSRLFSRKATAALNADSTVDELFTAFASVAIGPGIPSEEFTGCEGSVVEAASVWADHRRRSEPGTCLRCNHEVGYNSRLFRE